MALELSYPVNVPIFFLDRPHPVIMPVLLIIALAFTAAAAAGTVNTAGASDSTARPGTPPSVAPSS